MVVPIIVQLLMAAVGAAAAKGLDSAVRGSGDANGKSPAQPTPNGELGDKAGMLRLVVRISSRDGLVNLRDNLLGGTLKSSSCIAEVEGDLSQTVSKAYNALYKVRALRLRGECGTVAGVFNSAGNLLHGNVAMPLAFVAREVGESIYQDEQFRAALCLLSADIVCDILVAGLHLAHNDGQIVRLQAGGRDWTPPPP